MITLASQRYTIAAYGGTLDSRYPDGDGIGTLYPELPRYTVDTTYSLPTGNTWTASNTSSNSAAGDGATLRDNCGLQYALTNSERNDVIVLTAGATYTGNFTCPAKTGTGWVYVISSALANLPAGVRVVAGDAADMAKIVGTGNVIEIQANASHWRFCGVEVADPGDQYYVSSKLTYTTGASDDTYPSYIIVDRCWIHGTASYGGGIGVFLGGRYWAVINSRISDVWQVGVGDAGAERQAILALGYGPYLVENNYLEGAGENIMFGGGGCPVPAAGAVDLYHPEDITIRGNHIYLPTSWAASTGSRRTIKNLLELKKARRVLIEGNLLENLWAGQGQAGFAVVFTPRNEYGGQEWAEVRDVTFRYNRLKRVSSGFNILANDYNYPSKSIVRLHIHNNEVDLTGTDTTLALGATSAIAIGLSPGVAAPSDGVIGGQNWRYEHNTTIQDAAVVSGSALVFGGITRKHQSLYILNNLMDGSVYGVNSADGGGWGTAALNNHCDVWEYSHNALFSFAENGRSSADYPGGTNYYPADQATVAFTNAAAGDYSLSGASPYKSAASDGADIGCNIAALNAALND